MNCTTCSYFATFLLNSAYALLHPHENLINTNESRYVSRLDITCLPILNATEVTKCDINVEFSCKNLCPEKSNDYISFNSTVPLIYDESRYFWNHIPKGNYIHVLCLKNVLTHEDVIYGSILEYRKPCGYVSKLMIAEPKSDEIDNPKCVMEDFAQKLIRYIAMGVMLHLLALPFLVLLAYAIYKLMLREHIRSLVSWLDDYMNTKAPQPEDPLDIRDIRRIMHSEAQAQVIEEDFV